MSTSIVAVFSVGDDKNDENFKGVAPVSTSVVEILSAGDDNASNGVAPLSTSVVVEFSMGGDNDNSIVVLPCGAQSDSFPEVVFSTIVGVVVPSDCQ